MKIPCTTGTSYCMYRIIHLLDMSLFTTSNFSHVPDNLREGATLSPLVSRRTPREMHFTSALPLSHYCSLGGLWAFDRLSVTVLMMISLSWHDVMYVLSSHSLFWAPPVYTFRYEVGASAGVMYFTYIILCYHAVQQVQQRVSGFQGYIIKRGTQTVNAAGKKKRINRKIRSECTSCTGVLQNILFPILGTFLRIF